MEADERLSKSGLKDSKMNFASDPSGKDINAKLIPSYVTTNSLVTIAR
jgi:hypothetical protein